MKLIELIVTKLKSKNFLIRTKSETYSIEDILSSVESYSRYLKEVGILPDRITIGVAMKTSYEFVISDFLCLKENCISLPIPLDFNDTQIISLLGKVDVVLVATPKDARRIFSLLPNKCVINIRDRKVNGVYEGKQNNIYIPKDIVKIIHTSGTTSNPKGVMIRDEAMVILLEALLKLVPSRELNYLSIVPMSLLIEQVLAIYLPILAGGSLSLLPEGVDEFGSQFMGNDIYLDLIKDFKPDFMYLAPKLLDEINSLESMTQYLEKCFIITGGAKVNHDVLLKLSEKGVIVNEGYGLSENTSVVSLNCFDDNNIGSAGKILPHIEYKTIDGELLIKSKTMCYGYFFKDDTSCSITDDGFMYTGDIVEFDDEQNLYIKGRKKNLIILSSSRNVSPEWVESKLKKYPLIYDAVIFGEGLEYLHAVIMPSDHYNNFDGIVSKVNSELPLFAKIGKYTVIENVEFFRKDFYTVTGRPKRSLIQRRFINE